MPRWVNANSVGAIGYVGMVVFFGTELATDDNAPAAILIPAFIAMVVGVPASWYLDLRGRRGP